MPAQCSPGSRLSCARTWPAPAGSRPPLRPSALLPAPCPPAHAPVRNRSWSPRTVMSMSIIGHDVHIGHQLTMLGGTQSSGPTDWLARTSATCISSTSVTVPLRAASDRRWNLRMGHVLASSNWGNGHGHHRHHTACKSKQRMSGTRSCRLSRRMTGWNRTVWQWS